MRDRIRRLTYRFLTLSYSDRMRVLISLDLLVNEDEGLLDAAILRRVLDGITEAALSELEAVVEKKHGGS